MQDMEKFVIIVTGLALTWLAVVNGAWIFGDSCPSAHEIAPCNCSKENKNKPIISCENLTSDENLASALMASKKKHIFGVQLKSVHFMFFLQSTFNGTNIKSLEISNSSIFALSENNRAFVGLENSLATLKVNNCSFVNNWEWPQLQMLKKLHHLEISNSELLELNTKFLNLSDLPLEEINLKNNHINSVPYLAFANFTGLTKLAMDYNELTSIMRTMLPIPAKKLESLGFSYNKIEKLPYNAFTDMPNLKFLYLGGNLLHTLEYNVFKPVWKQLVMALFQETPLICDCRIMWITTSKRTKKSFVNGRCQFPNYLKGKQLLELAPENLSC